MDFGSTFSSSACALMIWSSSVSPLTFNGWESYNLAINLLLECYGSNSAFTNTQTQGLFGPITSVLRFRCHRAAYSPTSIGQCSSIQINWAICRATYALQRRWVAEFGAQCMRRHAHTELRLSVNQARALCVSKLVFPAFSFLIHQMWSFHLAMCLWLL